MDTKSTILKTALELYNNLGVDAVTSRHIAAKMGISPGNLHYHFKQTDDIIKTLYGQLTAKFDAMAEGLELAGNIGIAELRIAWIQSFELMYKYRFLFLHFVSITIRIPSIREHYQALVERRTVQFLNIFQHLMEDGIFRNDLPDNVMRSFVTQIFIVVDFWLSNNELTLGLKGKEAVEHYSGVFFMMLYPYLTPEAQRKLA